MNDTQPAVLIPAYKPDQRLCPLLRALRERGFERLIVVDDGSGEAYASIFEEVRGMATLLKHEVNQGKGAALKTGLRYVLENDACPVVTADADGQHTPEDIARVAQTLCEHSASLVMGVRDKSQMPLRSKMGNTLTCVVMGIVTGLWLRDTQTGLRGLPLCALDSFSRLSGDRYEYELNMLMEARHDRMAVEQIVIQTVYHDNNAGSHFRALRDGLRIYALLFRQIGRFIGSSALAGLIDLLLYSLIHYALGKNLFISVAMARAISSTVNYIVNRKMVFQSMASKWRSAVRFYLLVLLVMLGSYLLIRLFTELGMGAIAAKLLADGVMFLINYQIQQRMVFNDKASMGRG